MVLVLVLFHFSDLTLGLTQKSIKTYLGVSPKHTSQKYETK